MAKKKKNNRLLGLAAVAAALGILIGVYFTLNQDTQVQEPQATAEPVAFKALESFSTLEVDAGEVMNFVRGDSGWVLEKEPERPLDQTLMQEMETVLTAFAPIRQVGDHTQDLDAFGLNEGAVRVRAGEAQIRIGDENPVTGDRYVLWHDGTVYTAKSAELSVFTLQLEELTAMESLPTITSDAVKSLVIRSADEKTEYIRLDAYEKPQEDDPTQKYLWYVTQDGVKRPAETSDAKALVESFTKVALGACVEYESNAETLNRYGLDVPAFVAQVEYMDTVTTTDGMVSSSSGKVRQFRLDIGQVDADGTAYVRFNDSEGIYSVNGSKLMQAVGTSAQALWPMTWIAIGSAELQKLNIVTRSTFMEFDLQNVTETDEEGHETSNRVIRLNGGEVDAADFAALYASLTGLKVEDRVLDGKAESEESVLTLNLSVGAEPLVIKLLPYDTSFYLADQNGAREFLLNRREVDAFCEEVMEFYLSYAQAKAEE